MLMLNAVIQYLNNRSFSLHFLPPETQRDKNDLGKQRKRRGTRAQRADSVYCFDILVFLPACWQLLRDAGWGSRGAVGEGTRTLNEWALIVLATRIKTHKTAYGRYSPWGQSRVQEGCVHSLLSK